MSRYVNRFGWSNILRSFLEAYKSSETKKFFPYEWFDGANKLEKQNLPPCEAFIRKRRYNNAHDKDFKDYQNSGSSELDEQQALKKLQVKTVPAFRWDNYKYLPKTWPKHGVTTF